MTERLPHRPGEAIRRDRPLTFDFEGRGRRRVRGGHRRIRARGAGRLDHGTLVQVPPGARPVLHDRCLSELPDAGRRDPERPLVHRAGPRRDARRAPERVAERGPRHPRLAEHLLLHDAAGLLLQDLPPTSVGVATVEPFIRSKAGLGKAPTDADHEPREVHNLHADVLVIGAGAGGPRGGGRGRGRRAPRRSSSEERAEVGAATSPSWRRRPRRPARGSSTGTAGVRGVRRAARSPPRAASASTGSGRDTSCSRPAPSSRPRCSRTTTCPA